MANTYRRWIYHKDFDPKIIISNEFEKYESEGWADSPAKFSYIPDFGVDPEDEVKVNMLGEAIDGVADRINGELNISVMGKNKLEEYARRHFDVELDKRKSLKALRLQVKGLM
jgi:hypothetical protein